MKKFVNNWLPVITFVILVCFMVFMYRQTHFEPIKQPNIDSISGVISRIQLENKAEKMFRDSVIRGMLKWDSLEQIKIKRLYKQINEIRFHNNNDRRIFLDSAITN